MPLHRRIWITTACLLGLLLGTPNLPIEARDAPTTTVPRYDAKTLFESTSANGASFSPDETSIVLNTDATGVFNAYRIPIQGGTRTPLTASTTDGRFVRTCFPKDGRILLSGDRGGNEITHLYVRELDGTVHDITPGDRTRTRFMGWHEDGSCFYVSDNARDPRMMDVHRYRIAAPDAKPDDPHRYTKDLVATNPGDFGMGTISRDGRWLLLSKSNSNADNNLYLWDLKHPSSAPDLITPHEGDVSYGSGRFTPDSKVLYYTSNQDSDFQRLWKFDLGTKKHELVAEHEWDINSVQFSEDGRWRLIRINADAQSVIQLHDRKTGKAKDLAGVPQGQIFGTTFSRSGRYLAFYVNTDRSPADLYVADLEQGGIRKLTDNRNPAVDPAHLVDAEIVRYPSFDELKIPALLYKPHGASKENPVPAMVWVHGGPGGQSRKGYRPSFQHLVNHGYAILAVNNRGSSGYGKTFHHMDDRKHGDVDLKDCIWGRTYLETLDWVDGDKIGIMGGSYGGYMTVAALAFAPDAFEVGIDIFGVTNWLRTLKSIPPWWTAFRKGLYAELGDPATDEERLRRISPLFHADKITKPLQVIQGANDPRVLKAESDEIVEAVKKNGVPVDYVVFDDEGHGFRKRVNRIRAAEASLGFLEKHLRGQTAAAHPKAKAIDAQVQPYIDAERLVGVVIGAISKEGSYVQGYGRVAPDRDAKPDGDTVYEIGSVSKVFTGVLLAALDGEGTVKLDTQVASLVPESLGLKPIDGTPMTLRHLSTHASGLPRLPANFKPKDPEDPYADYTEAQLFEALADVRARSTPGKAYAYSNLGTGLLGHLLGQVAKSDYEALIQKHITKPLGMTSTSVALSEDMRKRLAPGFDEAGRPVKNWDLGILAGAGGIRSTVHDMMRFAAANLEEQDDMLGKALGVARAKQSDKAPGQMHMGLGWHVAPNGVYVHSGQTGGYHSFLAVDPDKHMAVVVLSNNAQGFLDQIGNMIGRVLLGMDVPAPKVERRVQVDPKLLAEYVGRYELQPGFVIAITVEDGVLFLQATGQQRLAAEARSPTTFGNEAVGAEIAFERGDDQKVVRLVLKQNGMTLPAKRLKD